MPEKNQNNFIIKLKALMHDPVHKIWAMGNKEKIELQHQKEIQADKWHEQVAEDLFRFILSENLKDDKMNTADKLASTISRIVVAPNISDKNAKKKFNEDSSVFLDNAKYIDPFSGNKIDIGFPKNQDEVKNIFEKIGELNFSNQEERARLSFLFLWRFLP